MLQFKPIESAHTCFTFPLARFCRFRRFKARPAFNNRILFKAEVVLLLEMSCRDVKLKVTPAQPQRPTSGNEAHDWLQPYKQIVTAPPSGADEVFSKISFTHLKARTNNLKKHD